jgi:glucose/arabinose dehydrogenase
MDKSHELPPRVRRNRLIVLVAAAAASSAVFARAPGATRSELRSYHFRVEDLAEPSTSAPNPPQVMPRPADAALTLPPGFRAEVFADDLKRPRMVVEAPNGDVFVSDPSVGSVLALHDGDGNHVIDASERSEFATGLKQPFGMAFHGDSFYVAATDAILRFGYTVGQRTAAAAPEKIADLPSGPTGHWTRNLRFSPDGAWLYVTVGSSSNIDIDPDPLRAAVLRFKPDGSGREVVVTGTRNPVGIDFHPATHEPWITVQERDGLGDELVPDYMAHVRPGDFFGWPYAYIGGHEDPRHKGERPDRVKDAAVPEVILQAHSSVMGLAFYGAHQFPEPYRGGAFVAFRGSSGRTKRTGYKVVFVPFTQGKAVGGYDDFVVGWMVGEDSPEVWGRPVGLTVLRDGSMLVTDDGAGRIWRITYGARAAAVNERTAASPCDPPTSSSCRTAARSASAHRP